MPNPPAMRVIPEIDVPGHTDYIAKSHAELIACTYKEWRYYGSEPAPRTCDPLKIQTYAHIDNTVSDLADVFPDKFYHTCGDEINDRCPYGDKSIGAYLNQRNMSTHQILARFIDKMEDIVCNRK